MKRWGSSSIRRVTRANLRCVLLSTSDRASLMSLSVHPSGSMVSITNLSSNATSAHGGPGRILRFVLVSEYLVPLVGIFATEPFASNNHCWIWRDYPSFLPRKAHHTAPPCFWPTAHRTADVRSGKRVQHSLGVHGRSAGTSSLLSSVPAHPAFGPRRRSPQT